LFSPFLAILPSIMLHSQQQSRNIPAFVLIPLTYLGGIFYSIDMLPAFWQNVSLVNPILYMVNAMRYGMLGVSDIDLVTAFSIIILFVAALFSFCLYLLNSGKGIRS